MFPYAELSPGQRQIRLTRAIALSENARLDKNGIGMQKERTLHSVIKSYLEPDVDQQEIPIGPYVADIYHRSPPEALEVQTGNFGPLRDKLESFLAEFPVTVVHPIPWHTTVYWSDPGTGEMSKGHRSPRVGRLYEILPELYRVSGLLGHPGLTFMPMLVDVEEYRLMDGWSRGGKRGAHRIDRIPVAIGECRLLQTAADYLDLLPPLPDTFTAAEYGRSTRFGGRALSYSLMALRRLGVVEQAGRKGRSNLYRLTDSRLSSYKS